jgi:Rrf2 family nitric oxide-sensitive transcriptional repressor
MRLTRYTDYAIRVLLHLAVRPGRKASIAEIAGRFGISQSHLMKVVHDLASSGFIVSERGRGGGIRLDRPPGEINIGAVIRHTEDGFKLVDCDRCLIAPACGLTGAVAEALAAFMAVLDRYTLADLLTKREGLAVLLDLAHDPAPADVPARSVAAGA